MACVVSWGGFAAMMLALALNVGVLGRFWFRDERQRRAERTRHGFLVGEPCSYCGADSVPVERDWREPNRWVCQNAPSCVARGRKGIDG